MLKFFRRIRQKLISEGNLKRYLLYAIGEILLVVIGILIALQINNWNEANKNKAAELKALIDLRNEFEMNHNNLTFVMDRKKKADKELREYLQIITSDTIGINEKGKVEEPDIAGFNWSTNYSTLNSLLNSGKIDFFQNDSIKYAVSGWNDVLANYHKWETRYDDFALFKLDQIKSNYTTGVIMSPEIQELDALKFNKVPVLKGINDSLKLNLIKDYKYYEALANVINTLNIHIRTGNDALDKSIKIQELLKKEIAVRMN